jgi:phosphoribosylpyrophosphate synthetase
VLGSFPVGGADGLHELIRAARAGDPAAISDVLDHVRRAAPTVWPEIAAGVVVAVPGHLPGPAHPLLAAVSEEIAAVRGWRHVVGALRRHSPAPEGKAGGARAPAAEASTLEWRRPERGRAIILVDDVVRTGATLQGCARCIRVAGDERTVVAIALAAAVRR